jgi:hypothetical protein
MIADAPYSARLFGGRQHALRAYISSGKAATMSKNTREMARIRVTVRPASGRNEVQVGADGLVIRVTAPPVEGKANEMCLALLAEWLGIPKSRLTILSGARKKQKIMGIAGLDQAALDSRIRAGATRASPE